MALLSLLVNLDLHLIQFVFGFIDFLFYVPAVCCESLCRQLDNLFGAFSHFHESFLQRFKFQIKFFHGVFCNLLSVPALDVHFRLFFSWIEEDLGCLAELDDFSQQHENALVAGPSCLGHVVSDNHDRVVAPHALNE